jgi:uncharacterized protein YegL
MVSYDGPVGGQQEVYESPAEIGEIGLAHPGLFVFDVSFSTQAYISAMNAGVDKFACKLRQHPDVASSAWLGMVSFADDARTEFPLSRLADPSMVLPTLSARGSTNYSAAFQAALDQLRADLPQLTDGPQGRRKVFRPTIYMVTDGYPNVGGDWRVPLNELRTRSWRPNIFVFGYGDADRAVIREIASEGCAYFAKDGQTPESMFDAILAVILRSQIDVHITATANAAAAPGTAPVAPPPIDPATIGLGDQLQTIDPIGTID